MHSYALNNFVASIRAAPLRQMAEVRHFLVNHILDARGIDAGQLPAYKPRT